MMEIIPNTSKVLVKAADPLAKPEIPLYYIHTSFIDKLNRGRQSASPLYYTHSKTYLYNDIFFHFRDTMTPTLGNICLWMAVTSQKIFGATFQYGI
jgi:hypothetical protein